MQRITMAKIADSLREMKYQVTVATSVAAKARQAIENMLEIGRG
jgi:quinolinate synthase